VIVDFTEASFINVQLVFQDYKDTYCGRIYDEIEVKLFQ
jgi:hypothetical protein